MATAVRLLKPGGTLVYCTCTINPAENETNVRFALDRWGKWLSLEQAAVEGVAAGPGLTGVDPETGDKCVLPSSLCCFIILLAVEMKKAIHSHLFPFCLQERLGCDLMRLTRSCVSARVMSL